VRKENDVREDVGRARWTRCLGVGAMTLATFALGGCAATVSTAVPVWEVDGYAVAQAGTVPIQIETYPRVYYRDRWAYLVDGYWYYPSARGWVIFREEPRELARWRTRIYSEPQRYRQYEYGYPQERRRYREPR
jgi:hypothetical protein